MFPHLFLRLAQAVYFRRPIYVIQIKTKNTSIEAYLVRMHTTYRYQSSIHQTNLPGHKKLNAPVENCKVNPFTAVRLTPPPPP